MDTYDPDKPDSYILHVDANNLYGSAMSEMLPYKEIVFTNDVILEQVLATADYA